MVKLSIIIPFYNTYELTCKLLEELRKQITNEIEIFIIDDSNDKRLDNFKDLATIIHNKKRGGVSHSRNIGMDLATGEYLAFVDSDDMVSKDYIKSLLEAISIYNNDIIVFNWKDKNTGVICYRPENYAVWKAIYKREMCPKFNEDMWYNEDVSFQEEIDKRKLNKTFVDKTLYYYNSGRIGSNMWERDQLRRENMIKVEVTEGFTLARFDELLDIERKNVDKYGELFVGDTFKCDKELVDYLLGGNALKKAFVKVIEVIPEKEKEEVEEKPIKEIKKKSKK